MALLTLLKVAAALGTTIAQLRLALLAGCHDSRSRVIGYAQQTCWPLWFAFRCREDLRPTIRLAYHAACALPHAPMHARIGLILVSN